ncbi:biotin synthase [Rhodoferax koreense]|uniref:Biotin synthase n=1 Tax=Rhodoferax koreensis TaxID=1842727 RepID=A0A1P8K1C3_9BURK|nr:biotin synthase [Rhodoferax koreense]APW39797.1 biotin synthase [Rhodoferax koreense]
MPTELPPTIDPQAAARWAGLRTAASPWLHEEVARRMEDRLQWIKLQPKAWAHWRPVRGGLQAHGLLSARYPEATCYVVEGHADQAQIAIQSVAKPWWTAARWKAGAQRAELPPDSSVQMLWANMLLHSAADPQALMAQWHRALAVDGFLMFSCLGPDTALELRAVYEAMGWPAPGNEFTDMHDWGDMLVAAGFAEPVMDMERIHLSYATAARLLLDLREIGRNLHPGRFPALRGKAWRADLEQALARQLADAEGQGRLSMTFELIYGHALKPKPRLRLDAQSAISLRDMRDMLQRGPPGAS